MTNNFVKTQTLQTEKRRRLRNALPEARTETQTREATQTGHNARAGSLGAFWGVADPYSVEHNRPQSLT